MNENLNLVKVLKNCPKGTILYSPICGKVEFISTSGPGFPVEVIEGVVVKEDADVNESEDDDLITFLPDGRYIDYPNGECLLFPSMGNRDWSTFVPPTQEAETKVHIVSEDDKQLLLQDLCARLPYGVMVQFISRYDNKQEIETLRGVEFRNSISLVSTTYWDNINSERCRPYLRSMDDMTDEEKKEISVRLFDNKRHFSSFFYSHHIDCNGLIEKGLAIRVTDENNPYKG